MPEILQEHVAVRGPRGRMAGEIAYLPGELRAAALLINPHPLMGGRMDNNVVARLACGAAAQGSLALRFDYAGVGDSDGPPVDVAASMQEFWSTGRAPEDPLMIDDARAALAWLRRQADLPTVLIGYSFGAHVATEILDDLTEAVILIAPTINRHDFALLQRRAIDTLIVHSDNDFATGQDDLKSWMDALPGSVQTVCLPGADHFFRGMEDELVAACCSFIASAIAPGSTTESPCS